jgi:hypothetical protein
MTRMTTTQVAAAISANVDALYAGRPYEAFSAEQDRLWRYAESRSRRFTEMVTDKIRCGGPTR